MKLPTHIRFNLTYEATTIGEVLAPITISDFELKIDLIFENPVTGCALSVDVSGVRLRGIVAESQDTTNGFVLKLSSLSIADTPLSTLPLEEIKAHLIEKGCEIKSWLSEEHSYELQALMLRHRNTDELIAQGKIHYLRKWDWKVSLYTIMGCALATSIASTPIWSGAVGIGVFNSTVVGGLAVLIGQHCFVSNYAENHDAFPID